MTQVTRSNNCANSPKNAKAEDIALALMGVGELAPDLLAENAVWDRLGQSLSGRDAILSARETGLARITVDQVVTHGTAGSVSGFLARKGEKRRMFCHVIRYTSASATQVAHLVSFEHAG